MTYCPPRSPALFTQVPGSTYSPKFGGVGLQATHSFASRGCLAMAMWRV
jgi:hypothetical protein